MVFARYCLILFIVSVTAIYGSKFAGTQSPYLPILYVAKSSSQDEVRLHDLRTGFQLVMAENESIGVLDVAPNNEILVTTHAQIGSILNILDLDQHELIETIHGIDDNPVWSPSSDRVAYRRYYYQGGLYVFTRGQWPPRALDIRATAISWSPDGSVLAYSRWNEISNQEDVRTIDPRTHQDILLAGWCKPVRFMRWSPDGTHIALVTISGELHMLDLANEVFTPLLTERGQVRSVQWTVDGRLLGVIYTVKRMTALQIITSDGQLLKIFDLPGLESTSSFDWYIP